MLPGSVWSQSLNLLEKVLSLTMLKLMYALLKVRLGLFSVWLGYSDYNAHVYFFELEMPLECYLYIYICLHSFVHI